MGLFVPCDHIGIVLELRTGGHAEVPPVMDPHEVPEPAELFAGALGHRCRRRPGKRERQAGELQRLESGEMAHDTSPDFFMDGAQGARLRFVLCGRVLRLVVCMRRLANLAAKGECAGQCHTGTFVLGRNVAPA